MAHNIASTAVLSTPELLDVILHFCDPHTLIQLWQVCRNFRTHIQSTKRLRIRIFLEAEPDSVVVNDHAGTQLDAREFTWTGDLQLNPFLCSILRSPTDRHSINAENEPIHETWSIKDQVSRWKEQYFILAHLPKDFQPETSLSPSFSSWRTMMFTQPPVSSVAVFIGARRYANDHPRSPEYQIVSNSRGVTLGDIFDNIQERATTPYLRDAPFCIAVLKLCSYERAYSANFYAFIRYRGPQKS